MKKLKENLTDARRIPFEIAAPTSARFKKFCLDMFGVRVDEMPTEQGIFMKQSLSLVFYATIMSLITNGFYLVKNLISNNSPAIDMIPLYMMVVSSAAMLIFTVCYKKYDTQTARFALLAYYVMIVASVTVFMVSCNYHNIGLSISMCYLFIIMVAPTYKLSDTVALCVLIAISSVLPRYLPYGIKFRLFENADNALRNAFKHLVAPDVRIVVVVRFEIVYVVNDDACLFGQYPFVDEFAVNFHRLFVKSAGGNIRERKRYERVAHLL